MSLINLSLIGNIVSGRVYIQVLAGENTHEILSCPIERSVLVLDHTNFMAQPTFYVSFPCEKLRDMQDILASKGIDLKVNQTKNCLIFVIEYPYDRYFQSFKANNIPDDLAAKCAEIYVKRDINTFRQHSTGFNTEEILVLNNLYQFTISNKTKTIRVPEALVPQILEHSKKLDLGEIIESETKSKVLDLSGISIRACNGKSAVYLEDLAKAGYEILPESLSNLAKARIQI